MRSLKLRDLLESWDAGAWGEPAPNGQGVSVLRSTNFREGGRLSFENQAVLAIDSSTLAKKRLIPGDILLERSGGGPLQPVGRIAGFWGGEAHNDFICGNFISRLVPKKDLADSQFLIYVLLDWHMSGKTEKFQTATTGIRNLQMKQYLDSELCLPIDVDQQRQIAARLKAQLAEVETARQAAKLQLRDARLLSTKIVDSVFDQFEEWQPIAEIAKVQSGYAFKSESFKPSGVRLLRNANILPGEIYWDDVVYLDPSEASRYPSYVLEEGDVLISLDRPLISSGIKVARVGEADLPALLLQRVGRFVLKPDEIDADFLYAFLQSSRFIDAISGHDQSLGVPHISPGQVESVEIPLLPLDDQSRIVTTLKQQLAEADALRTALEQQLRDLDALPQRILAQVFNPQGK